MSPTLRYHDIPPGTLRDAALILDAPIRPDASGQATITDKPDRRIGPDERQALRALKIATAPAGKRTAVLLHVWETYSTSLPPRDDVQAGGWELRHVTILPNVPALWYNQLDASLHKRLPRAGRIPVLFGDDGEGKRGIWMSTSDLELATMSDALEECSGHVLVGGLGLGIFPTLAIRKPDVKSVTVVEIAPHIMDISAEYVARQGVRVVNQSIESFAARPPAGTPKFDYCFVDIWPYIQDPYEHEQEARDTVAGLMTDDGAVSMWCQALNDRKRASMARIDRLRAGAIERARPGTTCYSCGDEMTSSIAQMCVQCAVGTWKESPDRRGQEFPIRPDEIPEVAAIREAQRALASLDPELLAQLTARFREATATAA